MVVFETLLVNSVMFRCFCMLITISVEWLSQTFHIHGVCCSYEIHVYT